MTHPTITLIDNAAVTGDDHFFPGGHGEITVEATTWAVSTVTLERKTSNGTYIPVGTETTFTENGMAGFLLAEGIIRASISGGPPTGVRVYVKQIP